MYPHPFVFQTTWSINLTIWVNSPKSECEVGLVKMSMVILENVLMVFPVNRIISRIWKPLTTSYVEHNARPDSRIVC